MNLEVTCMRLSDSPDFSISNVLTFYIQLPLTLHMIVIPYKGEVIDVGRLGVSF